MANENFLQLPTVVNSTMGDVTAAVQSGVTVQETLQQIFNLFVLNSFVGYAGDPNGNLAGNLYQFCLNTVNATLYLCILSGSAATAEWQLISNNPFTYITPPSNGGTGIANPTAHGIAIAEGSANFNFTTLNNGQLLIGSNGVDPVPANITAGSNITISNGAGTITISASGIAGFTIVDVPGTALTMSANTGYIADNASLVTLTLPTTIAQGQIIEIYGNGAGGWRCAQNAGQSINTDTGTTTTGTGGYIASTIRYNSIKLICVVANTVFNAINPTGNITIV